jgi:hypothetical protein
MSTSIAALLWTLATLAACVALIECAARVWLKFGARTYPWKPYTKFDITPDAKILPNLSPRTAFMANSLGLRGKETPPTQNVFRIVACGGSAVECFSLDESEAWPTLVEQHLSQPEAMQSLGADAIHVLNFAKSGFTNEALGYLLPRVLDRVGPIDVLTITTGTSAANAWTKAGTPPYPQAPGQPWDDVDWHGETKYSATISTCAITELVRRARQWRQQPTIALRNTGGALAAGRRARQRR